MKFRILLFALLSVFMASCDLVPEDEDILIKNTPRSEVPAELRRQWLNGTFSMSEWWTYDGKNYLGNPYTRSTAFKFEKNGNAEFFLIIKTFSGYCSTEGFTYFKGTVKFENNNSFTFYPQKGNYRGFYSCASGSNFNRPAEKEELKPITLYYTMETDNNGDPMMVTSFGPNDPPSQRSYFKATSW